MRRANTKSEPLVTEYERDSVKVKRTWTPGGYCGSTEYEITGTSEAVTAEVDNILRCWPPAGYMTWFNWPPGSKKSPKGEIVTHRAPTDHGDGTWTARGYHSNSCD